MAQDPNQVRTAEIRSRIEQTRQELGHTIDAIQDWLSPRRVMHDVKESLSEATLGRARRLARRVNEAMHSPDGSVKESAMVEKARSNPAMTALIGTAVSAVILAVMSRSRRPRLARGLGGLALSLAMATFAQQRARRQPPAEPFPGAL
jgi:hypothetical protein